MVILFANIPKMYLRFPVVTPLMKAEKRHTPSFHQRKNTTKYVGIQVSNKSKVDKVCVSNRNYAIVHVLITQNETRTILRSCDRIHILD